ncbi:hypothetical protein GWI33_016174 [Rhynchophorus ferrugineus]|uniref:Uncharacterized protein n=1 Tax=Rhynchophorus ferrugineus TaxID=354439 RepID=A0A834M8X4_RHYFE|nr:hypothetical protein GWI33_016174 [Rhynchophorus ferrugineus]
MASIRSLGGFGSIALSSGCDSERGLTGLGTRKNAHRPRESDQEKAETTPQPDNEMSDAGCRCDSAALNEAAGGGDGGLHVFAVPYRPHVSRLMD